MTPELESELARLRRYDTLLSEVLPTDFKDWHKNSKEEWPLVAQKVIQSLQDREALAWEMAEKNAKMAEKYQKLAEAYQEYSELLGEEIHDIIPLAYVHGWQSRRVEQGRLLREKIETLKAGGCGYWREAAKRREKECDEAVDLETAQAERAKHLECKLTELQTALRSYLGASSQPEIIRAPIPRNRLTLQKNP